MSTAYTLFWFDVEDYLTPESDDALKGLLEVFEACGAQATWKIVGEKARVLEEVGRRDILRLLQRQDVGYHTDTHSQHPVLAEYLAEAGWDDGVEEVIRRERPGYDDVARILGPCSTFGQAGGSWAPQLYPFLHDAGIPLFMDEGSHIGLEGEPFWYCGILHINRMRDNFTRCAFDRGDKGLAEGKRAFDEIHARRMASGGGVISIYYHPCEWATTGFWDGVNFARGAMPPRHEWRPAPLRPAGEMAAGLQVLRRYLEHVASRPGVEIVTGRQILGLFPDLAQSRGIAVEELAAAATFEGGAVDVLWLGDVALAPSETFVLVCDALMEVVLALSEGADLDELDGADVALDGTPYGPVQRLASAIPAGADISVEAFIEAVADARQSVHSQGRVPAACWLGSQRLAPADLLVTAADLLRRLTIDGESVPTQVSLRAGRIPGEAHVGEEVWGWVIFPEGFSATGILEQARLQAWTLKPATLID